MEATPEQIKLVGIFHPYALERQTAISTKGIRFVHYTRADAAVNMLRTKEVWMRKSDCMNDFREVDYGLECLGSAYRSETGKRFKAALENVFKDILAEIEELFNGWAPHFQDDTYLTAVSEHDDAEDRYGRLSMWRAYGDTTGVAIVLNNQAFLSPSDALKAYTSPVAYLSEDKFEEELERVTQGIENNVELLRQHGRGQLVARLFHMFRFAALCTKHPGFKEEREWRIVYTPKYDESERLLKDLQVIGGSPQPIYKIPLKNIPEEGFTNAEIPELINRIIIGPTEYPLAIRDAFVTLLGEAGVPDPSDRVFVSDLPLRR